MEPARTSLVLVECAPVLTAGEPAAFESLRGNAADRLILVCDHASNRLPESLGNLGLTPDQLDDHIAWDIGAVAVARELQSRFDAAAVFGAYSRLAVDLNRSLSDPSAFPPISDGILIPGNIALTDAARVERARALHGPYHAEIDRVIDCACTPASAPAFVAVHSFTRRFNGSRRPWDVGVLWDKDPRLAVPLLAALRAVPGIRVGDNEPYSGRHPADYSIDHHAEPRGIAHVGIEICQDLVRDRDGQKRLAGILGDALAVVLKDPRVFARGVAETSDL